jgi:septum formation protein
VSVPPAPPLLLASTSPQRRAILEQLGIPFRAVPPQYEEEDEPGADPLERVREHARGKARSVADGADDCPVLGVDTAVVLDGRMYGKPVTAEVWFRPVTARDIGTYVASREWEGRAGSYAIQGRGAALVERVEGDYLNVVGLPAALLVRLLAARFAGVYGFG